MTPSLFDLPVRPSEAARLGVMVLEQAGSRPLTDEVRGRMAARAGLLKLESLRPWFGSLERDPVHPSAIFAMADNGEGSTYLLRVAPSATPSSAYFPGSILIGRMPGAGGAEMVVNAVPFGPGCGEAVGVFVREVAPVFQARARGGKAAIVVESGSPETVLPAAFAAFGKVLRERGVNVAGAADAGVGAWAAIRMGWREGWVSERDCVPCEEGMAKRRGACAVRIESAADAAKEIERCLRFLL